MKRMMKFHLIREGIDFFFSDDLLYQLKRVCLNMTKQMKSSSSQVKQICLPLNINLYKILDNFHEKS